MYLEHFGLHEDPFRITPHTEFFFTGAKRGAMLQALIYAITHDEGIVKVSGEVGSGKTMLCRMLLDQLPDDVETVYLANPSLSREDILHAIADELKIELPPGREYQKLSILQERLLNLYASGRRVVVIIDEAHAMPAETLEEIRLLSNLESSRHKLLHIVLFGQPELDVRLAQKDMRQLTDRITHHFALTPLKRSEIGDYLMYRLRTAGYRGPDLFTPRAISLINDTSRGLTRRINILADKALLAAFSEGKYQVDARQARIAIQDARLPQTSERNPWYLIVAGLVVTVLVATAATAWLIGETRDKPLTDARPATNEASIQTSAPALSETEPAEPSPAETASTESQRTETPQPEETPVPAPEKMAAPGPTRGHGLEPTLAERVAATAQWLESSPNSHFVIQMLNTDAGKRAEVQSLVDALVARLDPKQVRVYHSNLSGSDRLGVIYGDFPSREAAQDELTRLTGAIPAKAPYVRSVSKLK